MPTLYRVIKISTDTQESMDHQLDNSLADGIHTIGKDGRLQIATYQDADKFAMDLIERLVSGLKNTGVVGCITKKQLRELHKRQEGFDSR